MFKFTILCLLLVGVVLAEEYGPKKGLRRGRIGRRFRRPGPLYADSSVIYHPAAGFGPRPGYGYVRDVVVVDDDYSKEPPVKTDVIRDHDKAGYDLPLAPKAPRPPRVAPPVKTDVIRDHGEGGYDLPPPVHPVPVKEPYPPKRPVGYDSVPVAVPTYKKPAVVTRREEHVKETPYGVKHEVRESKHVGVAPPHPDPIAHYQYELEKTPDCAYATNDSVCLEDQEYPVDVLKYAIKKDKSYLRRLLADVEYQSADNTVDGLTKNQEEGYSYEHYFGEHTKGIGHHGAPYTDYTYNREYYKKGGYLCPASVAYVRPKRARNTRGQWKIIVNLPTDYSDYGHKYTQTVRLEKCIYPGAPCSYMGSEYHSKCLQKTNFERLLVWTYDLGLHIDVFRMPIACSCHMGGHGGKEYGKVKSY